MKKLLKMIGNKIKKYRCERCPMHVFPEKRICKIYRKQPIPYCECKYVLLPRAIVKIIRKKMTKKEVGKIIEKILEEDLDKLI